MRQQGPTSAYADALAAFRSRSSKSTFLPVVGKPFFCNTRQSECVRSVNAGIIHGHTTKQNPLISQPHTSSIALRSRLVSLLLSLRGLSVVAGFAGAATASGSAGAALGASVTAAASTTSVASASPAGDSRLFNRLSWSSAGSLGRVLDAPAQ